MQVLKMSNRSPTDKILKSQATRRWWWASSGTEFITCERSAINRNGDDAPNTHKLLPEGHEASRSPCIRTTGQCL